MPSIGEADTYLSILELSTILMVILLNPLLNFLETNMFGLTSLFKLNDLSVIMLTETIELIVVLAALFAIGIAIF